MNKERYVSVMSAWEIDLLDAKGRIRLGMPVHEWMDTFFQRTRFRLLRLDLPVALAAHQLPGEFHQDPADRLLVATARHHELTLLTEDHAILDYARQGYVRACRCNDKMGALSSLP
jgi:PIN domain nuclease of toxin-antitoxin system